MDDPEFTEWVEWRPHILVLSDLSDPELVEGERKRSEVD